jgi:predicted short-subunit dehydrogenase-like oxidoreductase (DUF2520 family)
MKKLSIGLVIEGNSSSSTLLRLPAITAELGPVKSSSLPVARRFSNFLKGGDGVAGYSDLASARTILIRVPDSAIIRVVSEICGAGLALPEHSFVLCETWSPTEKLDPLRRLGAATASLVALPTGSEKTFALEGDLAVVRQMRRLLDKAQVRALELRPGSKHLLFAATTLCSAFPIPLLLAAQQLLRESGLSGNQLLALIENLSDEMLAGFLKGARSTWGGALADSLKTTHGDHWDQLDATHPETAAALRKMLQLSEGATLRTRVQSA